MNESWYVTYEVVGFGKRQAGPYPRHEAEYQRDDIQGYEGVHSVRLTQTKLQKEGAE